MKNIYFVITTMDSKSAIRVYAMSRQTFSDGKPVRTDLYISCDKKVRTAYPVGTVFGCYNLVDKGKFYAVEDYKLHAVKTPDATAITESVPKDIMDEYSRYVGGSTGDYGEDPIPAPEDAKRKPTTYDRMLRDKKYEPPTINEDGFYVSPDIWALLMRNAHKRVNTMLLGPTGSGKTEIISYIAAKLGLKLVTHDMGAMHDPLTGLLGSHRIGDEGRSVFDYAKFTQDIQEEDTIITLDELSRAPLSTNNILFPCLDSRRELPVEIADSKGLRNIPVNESLCFFATANIGSEYTGTNIIDRALLDRFFPVELDYLPEDVEADVLVARARINKVQAQMISKIAKTIRNSSNNGELSTSISTRHTLLAASLVKDGFPILTAMQSVFLPVFEGTNNTGERSQVKVILSSK